MHTTHQLTAKSTVCLKKGATPQQNDLMTAAEYVLTLLFYHQFIQLLIINSQRNNNPGIPLMSAQVQPSVPLQQLSK